MKCRIGRTLTVLCTVICLVLCTMLATGSSVHAAGVATDTLTVKIGYWGMKEDTFVEKGTYHWTELDGSMGGALDSHKVAYSFYRQDDEGNYSTVIDSARGFYIMDLLDYANVDTSTISSISFYTKDQTVGYFTSFTYNELFSTERYYFEDLAGHLTPEYDDNGKFKGVKVKSSAWSDKVRVQPMLALEDS